MSSIPWHDMTEAQKQLHRGHVQRYRKEHKDQIDAQNQVYRESHRGQHKKWQSTQKTQYRQVKQEAITLLGGKCVRCQCDDMRCLEIDHILPVRGDRSTYGAKLYRSIVRGNRENVQVLCACCHAIKTYEDGNGIS